MVCVPWSIALRGGRCGDGRAKGLRGRNETIDHRLEPFPEERGRAIGRGGFVESARQFVDCLVGAMLALPNGMRSG